MMRAWSSASCSTSSRWPGTGPFTRAAEELWITQSALSQQVRRLEEELGVRLLHRTSRGAEPTPAGADLLARAETVLAELGAPAPTSSATRA
jgi:LysR family nitrogen assimilation transcriptional regulator